MTSYERMHVRTTLYERNPICDVTLYEGCHRRDYRAHSLARRAARVLTPRRGALLQHGQSPPVGSAPARPLCLLGARLAAPGSSVLPE